MSIDTITIGELQRDCPDFKDLYAYFKNDDLPEDKKHDIQIVISGNWQYPVVYEKMSCVLTVIVKREVHIKDLRGLIVEFS